MEIVFGPPTHRPEDARIFLKLPADLDEDRPRLGTAERPFDVREAFRGAENFPLDWADFHLDDARLAYRHQADQEQTEHLRLDIHKLHLNRATIRAHQR